MKRIGEYSYALRLPKKDKSAVSKVAQATGESINSILVLSIRKGLPLAQAALAAPSPRVTGVDPLPDGVLRRAYQLPDDSEQATSRQLLNFQSQREPE
jgi:hypothetical protein